MARPNVIVTLGNGNLGSVATSSDGVGGLILTGKAVADKLALNKVYTLSSTNDLTTIGVTTEDNYLVDKEVRAFYAKKGEGAELYIIVVSDATTLTAICDSADSSPLRKLIDAAGGRVRIVGVNKIAPTGYVGDFTQQIDEDAITAAEKAQETYALCAKKQRPFRLLMPACGWTGETEGLFNPRQSSSNAVAYVLASDDEFNHSAAIGQALGRLASLKVHQSIGRVMTGAIATNGWATNGASYKDIEGKADLLHDAGYIFYTSYTNKNGCYLNGDATAAPLSDDYSNLRNGRVADKASVICYTTYIDSILDNIEVDEKGNIPTGACLSYQSMLDNAVARQMEGEISAFKSTIDPKQDVLETQQFKVIAEITPKGVIGTITVNLSLVNPANK